jgi:hypothetical protein
MKRKESNQTLGSKSTPGMYFLQRTLIQKTTLVTPYCNYNNLLKKDMKYLLWLKMVKVDTIVIMIHLVKMNVTNSMKAIVNLFLDMMAQSQRPSASSQHLTTHHRHQVSRSQ